MLKTQELADKMARYTELSKEIKEREQEKDVLRAELTQHMREGGASITGIEAGGYRASISFRENFGFNVETETGEPITHDEVASRRKAMAAFFKRVDETLYVPSTEKIAKVIEAWRADPRNADKPLPKWCRRSESPILRVSGSGVK